MNYAMLMLMNPKVELVYRLENIDADDGVNIFDIAPILMDFGNLIKSANEVLALDQKIEVKVKPFKEGSWITEFILHQHFIKTLLNPTPTEQGVGWLLGILGLNALNGMQGVAGIIRFTKGKVSNFRKQTDGEFVTYTNENGDELKVSYAEHKLVQSPLVQVNYYNGVLAPLEKFPAATAVDIQVNGNVEKFTEEDRKYFEEYAKAELLEEVDQNIVTMSGVFIKPKRGSYSGEEKAYSFIMGESILWPTTIEDQAFLEKVKSGEVRLFAEDVLRVNLEVSQKKDITNKLLTQYSIKEVLEYIKYEKPHQLKMGEVREVDN